MYVILSSLEEGQIQSNTFHNNPVDSALINNIIIVAKARFELGSSLLSAATLWMK